MVLGINYIFTYLEYVFNNKLNPAIYFVFLEFYFGLG